MEIAQICEMEHDEILVDIQVVMKEAGMHWAKFSGTYRDAEGRVQPCYRFPKAACDELSICFPDDLRAAVDQLWAEKLQDLVKEAKKKREEEAYERMKQETYNDIDRETFRIVDEFLASEKEKPQTQPEPSLFEDTKEEEREFWAKVDKMAAKRKGAARKSSDFTFKPEPWAESIGPVNLEPERKENVGVTVGNPHSIARVSFEPLEKLRQDPGDAPQWVDSDLVEEVDREFLAKVDKLVPRTPLMTISNGTITANLPSPETLSSMTMSSLDIAELTGKDHADVLKDIRRVLEEDGTDAGRFSGVYLGGNGQERPCYHLPRFECDLVVSGYSVKYRIGHHPALALSGRDSEKPHTRVNRPQTAYGLYRGIGSPDCQCKGEFAPGEQDREIPGSEQENRPYR